MNDGSLRSTAALCLAAALAAGCGSNGGDGDGGDAAQQALIDEIAALFPFRPNQPLDQVFECVIDGSSLSWYLDFDPGGGIDLYTTLDTGDDLFDTGGSYTHLNNQLTIHLDVDDLVNRSVNLPNEVSDRIEVAMGMISGFTTDALTCVTIGHRYNVADFGATAHFQCPISNIQAATQDENAIEFVHAAVPFSFYVPGSAFRQRNRYVSGLVNPVIRRGYGIYRRDGNRVYAWYPNRQFDDYDYLSGRLANADMELRLDQAVVAEGPCPRT